MIQFNQVSLTLSGKPILKPFDLSIDQARVGIIGSNGGGKSSLVRLINGLLLPTEGEVLVDGFDTCKARKTVRQKVGFVFQNPDNQIVMPTVGEDFAFGLKNKGLSKDEIASLCEEFLTQYGLWEFKDSPAHLLSGGQKQLLAILGVLATKPEYIVFDEPTTLLDLRNRKKIAQLIDSLSIKVIMITHDLVLLNNFQRVLVLDEGVIKVDSSPKEAIKFYEDLMA
ncbi:energy-coupling factor ABC transporter ATP-binding protein [Thorsellia kenyensis]|uniref:Energy-coupling factor ABC transporter ATP-binding protein n=1 Tax=Thorsellia kenyensis TaxID=1549888 RepID=A0ABV6CC01_9GAMM